MSQETTSGAVPGVSFLDRLKRPGAVIASLWSAPHRWENRATRFGVAAVLTMSAIQTAYFFGLASPNPVEKGKAIIFSGWMDFCLFMAFIRAQRASAQEEYGKAVAWFLGCLPLASFTFLCNFMFSSNWHPPDPLALVHVGVDPLVALSIYACVPLVAVVYGTLFTVKELSPQEKLDRLKTRLEAQWQAEIATPRGRVRKLRQMRGVLAEQLGVDVEDGEAEEQALLAAYEDLLAERGVSLVDREAPLHFEALLQEMRRLGISPRAANATSLFRMRAAELPSLASNDLPSLQPSKQISPAARQEHLSLAPALPTTSKRSTEQQAPRAEKRQEQVTTTPARPGHSAAAALQSMLAGNSDAWTTLLTVEDFISETGYNADYIKRLMRTGAIKWEERDGVRHIPLAELARFAVERLSEELAARVLARQAEVASGRRVVEADRGEQAAAKAEEEAEE